MVPDGNLRESVPGHVDENVSYKVVRIVQSHVGVVNRMNRRKGRTASLSGRFRVGLGPVMLGPHALCCDWLFCRMFGE